MVTVSIMGEGGSDCAGITSQVSGEIQGSFFLLICCFDQQALLSLVLKLESLQDQNRFKKICFFFFFFFLQSQNPLDPKR